jgi:exodeoxyribonuclease V gamma subunit
VQIAILFEQYLVYRQDWLARWFRGEKAEGLPASSREHEHWQSALWREIERCVGSDGVHPFDRFSALLRTSPDAVRERLPRRLHLFCLSAIPPLYLDMIDRIGKVLDVYCYVLNPCREFWFDIVSPKRMARLKQGRKETYRDTGNALLASWGNPCRAFLSLALENLSDELVLEDCFIEDAGESSNRSLLSRLQAAILNLEEMDTGEGAVADADYSVEIHDCHSLLREVEVLRDQLLRLFAQDSSLRPEEILVVTPDIDDAAPLIDMVFGGGAPDAARVPFRITGHTDSRINPVATVLLGVLNLALSRFLAAEAYDMLLHPLVGKHFGLSDDLDMLRQWLIEAGVCWALNGDQKKAYQLPDSDRHTFHDGFNRLLYAYTLPPGQDMSLAGFLPAGNPEGLSALALGRLWHYVAQLKRLRESLLRAKTPEEWRALTHDVLDAFMGKPDDDTREDAAAVQGCVNRLFVDMASAADSVPLDAHIFLQALADALETHSRASTPTGVVCFTGMGDFRHIPYKVICVIGMNDGVFPSVSRSSELDLMAGSPRIGDRQRREDDRNLFLDILLSAREKLYISYTGHGVRDDRSRPPSILVSELLDYLGRTVMPGEQEDSVRSRFILEHPLQAFSRRYFCERDEEGRGKDARLVSYHNTFRSVWEKAGGREKGIALSWVHSQAEEDSSDDDAQQEYASVFFHAPLPLSGETYQRVSLVQLQRFFSNTSRTLLRDRLGIDFPREQDELPAHEPFLLLPLDRARLSRRILPRLLEGQSISAVFLLARSGVECPSGSYGELILQKNIEELASFASKIRDDMLHPLQEPLYAECEWETEEGAWVLCGALYPLYWHQDRKRLVRYRDARFNTDAGVRFRLAVWIEHLFLCATQPEDVYTEAVCHFRDISVRFSRCAAARAHLKTLMSLYHAGLQAPLPFFPVTSSAYMDKEEMGAARKKWKNPMEHNSEGSDRFHALALRGVNEPLGKDFVRYAKVVMAPMREAIHRA